MQPGCSWWPMALPPPNPVDITYTVNHDLDARTGQINDLGINTGGVTVHVNGTYAMTGQQVTLALHLVAPNLPINQVQALLPAAGVRLPSGSSLQGGTLTANLAITGPATAVTISVPGPGLTTRGCPASICLRRSEGLKPVSGTRGGTQIQTLRADVNSSAQGTRIEKSLRLIPPARYGHRRRVLFLLGVGLTSSLWPN